MRAARARERVLTQRADQILEMLQVTDIRDRRVGALPYGVLKLLEVGCALATDPDVLLLDEPSSGMGPEEAHELGDRLLDLRRDLGLTMLLIEHHVPLVTAVCDYVYVLNFGRLLAEGEPSLIRTHPEVVAAYLGGEAPGALQATREPAEDADLEHTLDAEVANIHPLSELHAVRARRPRPRPASAIAQVADTEETMELPAVADEPLVEESMTVRPRGPRPAGATRTPRPAGSPPRTPRSRRVAP